MFSFRYLGVTLTPSLSWSIHIANVRSKSRKVLGLIFRHFYRFSSPITILRLYSSLVRPILEYCSPVWSPHSISISNSLESVQSFALKLASKFHTPASSPPLSLPSLSSRRLQARIKLLFAITRNLYFLPSPIVYPQACPPYPIRSYHPFNLSPIFCRTSSFSKSFFPSTIKIWNSLPPSFKTTQSYSLLSRYLSPTLANLFSCVLINYSTFHSICNLIHRSHSTFHSVIFPL